MYLFVYPKCRTVKPEEGQVEKGQKADMLETGAPRLELSQKQKGVYTLRDTNSLQELPMLVAKTRFAAAGRKKHKDPNRNSKFHRKRSRKDLGVKCRYAVGQSQLTAQLEVATSSLGL